MLITPNPRKMKVVHTREVCDYHKRHPGASWPGCTCSSSYVYTEDDNEDSDARAIPGWGPEKFRA